MFMRSVFVPIHSHKCSVSHVGRDWSVSVSDRYPSPGADSSVQKLEADGIVTAYGKRALILTSLVDECCPATSYRSYWEAMKRSGEAGPKIMESPTMTHEYLALKFLQGLRRAAPEHEHEDNMFAAAVCSHLKA